MTLRFDWDPVPATDVRTPELAATWSTLQIDVGGVVATLVEDKSGRGAPRRRIDVPTYPLAEWIAYNWWSITSPAPAHGDKALNLAGAADGLPWPDLTLLPAPGSVLARLEPADRDLEAVRFLTQTEVLMSPESAAGELRRFVDDTIRRLQDAGVARTPLEEEWDAIVAMTSEQVAFCRTAAALGLDPFDLSQDDEQVVLALGSVSEDADLITELAAAVGAEEARTAETWLRDALAGVSVASAARRPDVEYEPLPFGRARAHRPWSVGYERARRMRESLGLGSTDRFEVEDFVGLVAVGSSAPRGIAGLASARDETLTVALPSRAAGFSHGAGRFAAARAIGRRTYDARDNAVLSDGSGYGAKVERAFAAELLAPAAGIEDLLWGQPTEEGIAEAASVYGVSMLVVAHQVENQIAAY